ncbi:hypothetical protein H9Q10_04350 [Eikenella sp. S3360]|uniref:Uncharacterized protein n=1 Tax=Eikenella glucosivorans TaxID=2766967 RepID=A0ABS0N9C2_9NEIS|nr:hypothetical protein [Eikenella glucosivorans]MBH5328896.1 hypothetical protein [Eikenella glucosivorans]
MRKIKIALLLFVLAALGGCEVKISGGWTDSAPAEQSNAPAAPSAPILQNVEVGKTTLEQARALYPDLQRLNGGYMSFGNRILTDDSGAIEVYQREIRGNIPQHVLVFDGDSKVLQMVALFRADKDVAPFVRELEIIGFAPYPQLTEQEFAILNSGMFVTAEERQKVIDEEGWQQFKRGDLFALIVPAEVNNGIAGLTVTNLAYEPTHRAKWQRQQAAQR